MFRFLAPWPTIYRALQSSQVPARPPRRARHHTLSIPDPGTNWKSVRFPPSFPVTSLADSGSGTLRAAITQADSRPVRQKIRHQHCDTRHDHPGKCPAGPEQSQYRPPTVWGRGPRPCNGTPASYSFRVFKVVAGETVCISGLTIAGGNAGTGNGGGIDNFGR